MAVNRKRRKPDNALKNTVERKILKAMLGRIEQREKVLPDGRCVRFQEQLANWKITISDTVDAIGWTESW